MTQNTITTFYTIFITFPQAIQSGVKHIGCYIIYNCNTAHTSVWIIIFPSYGLYKILRILSICWSTRACSKYATMRPRQRSFVVLASSTPTLSLLMFNYSISFFTVVYMLIAYPKSLGRALLRYLSPLL